MTHRRARRERREDFNWFYSAVSASSAVRILLLFFSVQSLIAADADLILHNGKIITADEKFSIAQAVAVRGGRIALVGSDESVLAGEKGPKTEVIDLQGRTVLPGLIDSHVHAVEAGLSEFRGALPPLDSFE